MLLWLIPAVIALIVVIVTLMSYFADKEYWLERVREGGHSRADFKRDVKHFEVHIPIETKGSIQSPYDLLGNLKPEHFEESEKGPTPFQRFMLDEFKHFEDKEKPLL